MKILTLHVALLCVVGLAACGGDEPAPVKSPPLPTFDTALDAALAGDAERAKQAFAAVAEASPDDLTPRIFLALLGGDAAGLAGFAEGEDFEAALARWAAGARESEVLMMAAGSVEEDAARAAARTRARFYLGFAAERAGDLEAARKHYEAAVTRAGGVAELTWAQGRLAELKGS